MLWQLLLGQDHEAVVLCVLFVDLEIFFLITFKTIQGFTTLYRYIQNYTILYTGLQITINYERLYMATYDLT